MSRVIKFRAWDAVNEHMYYDIGPFIDQGSGCSKELALMQFTSLLDKNGKEIYEGDIVRYFIDGYEQATPYVVKDLVEFVKDVFHEDPYYRWDDTGEVIGNVHEDPELLK